MKSRETISMRGVFTLTISNKGKVIETFTESNLVVNSGLTLMSHLIAGDVTPVTKIGFGTSGQAAVNTDTSLTNPVIKDISSSNYPQPGHVQFNWTLDESEANGMNIFEFGLFTAGNTLFSRKVREQAIVKTADMSLAGSWTVIFERS